MSNTKAVLREARSGLVAYTGGANGACSDTIARIDTLLVENEDLAQVRMRAGERIIEQTDTTHGTVAQTVQRLDGTDYYREMPATVEIDLRTLQTLLDLAEMFDDTVPEDLIHEVDTAMEQAREVLMLPEIPDAGTMGQIMAESL